MSTAVPTAALAHLFSDRTLLCHLEQQCQVFFRLKNSHAIRSIQDGFRCCGLRSLHDRAWPFKDQNHGENACKFQPAYKSCLTTRSEHQRSAAWMIFVAAVFAFAAKLCWLLLPCHIGVFLVVTDTRQFSADCITSIFRLPSELTEHATCQQEAQFPADFTPGSAARRGKGERCRGRGTGDAVTLVKYRSQQ